MKNIFSPLVTLEQYKIQLVLFGVFLSISGFQIWKYSQEQYEKFLTQQQKYCQQDFDIAESYVNYSKSLYGRYYLRRSSNPNSSKKLRQPGINSPLKTGEAYILIYDSPTDLIPVNPRYGGQFFERITRKWKETPPPLMVAAESLQSKKAIVTTSCSPQPFSVPLENLYETFQENDFSIPAFSTP